MPTATELILAIVRSEQHTIRGRVTKDPEIRYFESGKCKLSMSIAVNKPGAKRDDGSTPDWFKPELWNEDALAAADQLRKGDLAEFTGRVVTESWETNNGDIRTDMVIKVDEWKMVSRPVPRDQQAPAPAPGGFNAGEPMANWDDEIPF